MYLLSAPLLPMFIPAWWKAQRIISKNHRMVVRRDLWTSSGLPAMLKQGHLQLGAQGRVQTAYEYLQGWRLCNLSLCNLCQCSVTLTMQECFLMFRENFLCFRLCPLCLVLSLGTTEKNLALSSLHLPTSLLLPLSQLHLSS